MTLALIGNPTRTNVQLAYAWRALGVDTRILWPREALETLAPGDTAITRLDVLPSLDGVEPGLELVGELGERGVRVLNRPQGLLAAHDKLLTAERLVHAALPHPWTIHVERAHRIPVVPLPCVVKPRFGSWGQEVHLCRTLGDLERCFERIVERPWWRAHGALVQELVGPVDHDVRVVVAGDSVVAGAQRRAAPGEWRTNVTLGGRVVEAELPAGAAELAVGAIRALGIDFAGVDLLPVAGGWTILELNGAVDFDTRYSLAGIDPFAAVLEGLGIAARKPRAMTGAGTLHGDSKEVVMVKTVQGKPAQAGDEILITGHSVGDAPRTAVILEVLGGPGHERFHVRWEDGHESIFFPGEDAVVRRPEKRRRSKSAA
ncbi:MAG TPA: DUF1918 domain-containing protein [Gaiellaceae bacterium]|nr:DUF1918 domain-containing protein [Gaiellaceae bacterium]